MQLLKAATGIRGLDELTNGGLPQGRPTLICGGAGCGKTLLSMEFLVHGAQLFGEPGVFMAFEETVLELSRNVASLGFDVDALIARQLLAFDFVRVERSELGHGGDYDLDGLFIRLGHAIDSIGAKRVVLDTLESLLSGLPNQAILRAELRRLFQWLKQKGVTTVITGERGSASGELTRQGLEEYVSDCVIVLDNRVSDMVSSRRLRVVKYRGSTHGGNEYPFLIDATGISVLPITSVCLEYQVSEERVPSGVGGLDQMLGGSGYFRGSSVLVSGTAGTGKSSLAAHFAASACNRGERALYFAFEESASQIHRNMRSIGLNLVPWVEQGLLEFHAARPTYSGLEMHLARMLKEIGRFDPQVVIVDPINSFVTAGYENDVKLMLLRLVDALKSRQVTGFFTSLTSAGGPLEQTDVSISSLIDTWLLVRNMESNGERNRGLQVLKSRGMPHSNQVREFSLSGQGMVLRDAYIGPGGVLTGSARLSLEASEAAELRHREQNTARQLEGLATKRAAMEVQIKAIQAEFSAEEAAALAQIDQAENGERLMLQDRNAMAHSRQVGPL